MMLWIFFAMMLSVVSPLDGFAETAEEKGLAVAREADRRDTGWGDSLVEMRMVLKNRHGQESTRSVRVKTLEVPEDGDKAFSVFDDPADVQGTALLTVSHKTGPDDQWLYLPALKRVKRIASADKSGSFMGSEFAYEDIGSQEVEKYTYRYLRDEVYDGRNCFVLERFPVDRYSGYRSQRVWIDQAEYRPIRIDFYDRKETLLKTLTWKGYRQYLDRYWRADEMFMVNHQTGKSTLLQWRNYKFRTGFRDSDFSQESLRRAR